MTKMPDLTRSETQTMSLPATLEIQPLPRPPRATVHMPGSKSITNRALVMSALAAKGHAIVIRGALYSEDTEIMVQCLRDLGFRVAADWPTASISVASGPDAAAIPAAHAELFVGNSGTTMRFLTAILGLGHGHYRLDGVPRMRERPIGDLLRALRQLGVDARAEHGNECPPVIVEATGMNGGSARIRGDISSQFLSGLLLAAPYARGPVTIEVDGPLVSRPYVDMTVRMLKQWGFEVKADENPIRFRVGRPENSSPPSLQEYQVEPDASAASYFWAAAAITGGEVALPGLSDKSIQGDVRFIDLLEEMGCRVERGRDRICVRGGELRGIDADMNEVSDTVMTLAAVACFARGPTTIRGVAHIRHKETDRIAALAAELRRIGAAVDEKPDGLVIRSGPIHGAAVETYNDHRMAMGLALVGLRVPGIVIKNPACVAKTYPRFFEDLEKLRVP
jgi:3-phosphoshikimate 1-carboxyvinyltransferase